jgi:DNA-binding NtrC family response regulator
VEKELLKGKKVLIVDDEPDVLDTLSEILNRCAVVIAQTYDEARILLETKHFDIVILDIMGVNGYELLALVDKKKILVVMLTANALSVDDTVKSFKEGAASYIPKEKMGDIDTLLEEILDTQKKGKGFMDRWVKRFDSYYQKKFGSEWKKNDEEFWEKHGYWL